MQVLNYKFDILGNFGQKIQEMISGAEELGMKVKKTQSGIETEASRQ